MAKAFTEQYSENFQESVVFERGFSVSQDAPWTFGDGVGNTANTTGTSGIFWNGITLPDPNYPIRIMDKPFSGFYVSNALYVDSIYGNDTTATKYRADLPWKTFKLALNQAISGETIILNPGEHRLQSGNPIGEQTNLINGVDLYFLPGARLNSQVISQAFNLTGFNTIYNLRGAPDITMKAGNLFQSVGTGIRGNFELGTVRGTGTTMTVLNINNTSSGGNFNLKIKEMLKGPNVTLAQTYAGGASGAYVTVEGGTIFSVQVSAGNYSYESYTYVNVDKVYGNLGFIGNQFVISGTGIVKANIIDARSHTDNPSVLIVGTGLTGEGLGNFKLLVREAIIYSPSGIGGYPIQVSSGCTMTLKDCTIISVDQTGISVSGNSSVNNGAPGTLRVFGSCFANAATQVGLNVPVGSVTVNSGVIF